MRSRWFTLAALLGGFTLPAPAHAAVEGPVVRATRGAPDLPPLAGGPEAARAFDRAQDLHRHAGATLTPEERRDDATYSSAVQARIDLFSRAFRAYRGLERFGAELAVVSVCGQGLLLEEMATFLRAEPGPPGVAGVDGYEIAMLRQSVQVYRNALARYREAQRSEGADAWRAFAAERAVAVTKILRDSRSRLRALGGAPA